MARWIVVIVAIALLAIGALVALVYWDAQRWDAYREAHHCVQTGEAKPIIIQQCNMIGKVMVCQPMTITQHEWRCDGEELLWR